MGRALKSCASRRIAIVAVLVLLLESTALAGPIAYSRTSGLKNTPINGFTRVSHVVVPAGTFMISATGVIRNSNATQVAYIECNLQTPTAGVTLPETDSEFVAPPHLVNQAGVPGAGTFAITATVDGIPAGGAEIDVICGNFGPAADTDLAAVFRNMVAIQLGADHPSP
jgi:hypothetical protein